MTSDVSYNFDIFVFDFIQVYINAQNPLIT